MLQFLNIQKHKEYTSNVEQLYTSAFPKEEQVPFFYLQKKAKKEGSDIYAIFDNKEFVALLCLVYHNDIVFIFYLAICENKRNKGYGSQILNELKKRFSNHRIILNIEEVNEQDNGYDIQLKRRNFYIKNGFQDDHLKTEEKAVIYEMLCYGGDVCYEEYADLLKQYMGSIAFHMYYKKVI